MNKKHSKGITLIEILLVVGLLIILLSFAVPSINGAAIKADMNAATENVRYSLQAARRTARMSESEIMMNISSENGAQQTISFAATGQRGAGSVLQIQNYSLPPDIVLVSERNTFHFDERGLVSDPGRVLLVSRVDETVTSTIEIQ
ncbi:MAG: hypothetical protein HKN57_14635 [Xanthomonadales bacterium]|nr:hypothetical protein [Gammaproteobacteria bacterium]MBT8053292.1 hypothetical protein [Gammaproteobacteria bacterium]NND58481.1 hypothetical protein [Xanthomonadales bacterium]NNK50098.1 hypothetical protein [Xanthomonadales bacterium]